MIRLKTKDKYRIEQIKNFVKKISNKLLLRNLKFDINIVSHINTKASGLLEKNSAEKYQIYVEGNRKLRDIFKSISHELYHLYQLKHEFNMDYELMMKEYGENKQKFEMDAKKFAEKQFENRV